MKIGLIVGSLRKESFNKKIAEIVQKIIREGNEAEFIDISSLPFYNEDEDGQSPREEYTRFREEIKKYDGFIFFTPEYNRGVAPALKNALDIASRGPEGNVWTGKIAAIFSASMGQSGAMMGNHALRQSFGFLNLITLNQPEVYLAGVQNFFDEDGNLVKDTRAFIEEATKAYIEFAKKHA